METLISDQNKILVIQTAYPGDAILTLPLIQELKKKFSQSTIDVLCIPATSEIFRASPAVDNVWELDKRGRHKSIFALFKFINKLKKNHYTKIYCPHRSLRSALITLQMGVRESFGFDNSSLKFAFKYAIVYDYTAHEVKRNLSLISANYVEDSWKILPQIKISEEIKDKIREFTLKNNLESFITIAPGSVWQTKKYPLEYYKEIVGYLIEKNYTIVIIGGKDDRELGEQIKSEFTEGVINVCGGFSFIENIELLKYTRLLICNDSAPTHLGMCADIPVLTIYCSTIPQFGFYPYNNKSRVVSYGDLKCKPCGIHGHQSCPVSTFDCAKLLTPETVFHSIEEILQGNGEKTR